VTPFLFFLTAAIILIILEIAIFQFAVFWSVFIGLGALIASFAAMIYPEISWLVSTAIFVASSVLICIVLYRPLKNWQNKPSKQPGHDAVGQMVTVTEDIRRDSPGKVTWSGTDWSAYLSKKDKIDLSKGDTAYIESMEGIRLTVRKAKP
jgi:membrane protein implicated in regulation of membrane protease activity